MACLYLLLSDELFSMSIPGTDLVQTRYSEEQLVS